MNGACQVQSFRHAPPRPSRAALRHDFFQPVQKDGQPPQARCAREIECGHLQRLGRDLAGEKLDQPARFQILGDHEVGEPCDAAAGDHKPPDRFPVRGLYSGGNLDGAVHAAELQQVDMGRRREPHLRQSREITRHLWPSLRVEVVRSRDEFPRSSTQRPLQQVTVYQRPEPDGDIGMGADQVDHIVGHVEPQADLGIAGAELGQAWRDGVQQKGHRCVDTQRPARGAPAGAQLRKRLGPGEDVARSVQEIAPLGRHFDHPRRAAQKRHAQLLFQPTHRPAEGRGRDPQTPGRLGKAVILDDRDKGHEVPGLR